MYRKEVINKLGWLYPRAVNGIHNAPNERQPLVCRATSVLGHSKTYYVPAYLLRGYATITTFI